MEVQPVNKNLFVLIKSLEKSEKRHIRLSLNRYSNQKSINTYIKIFDIIDKQEEYNEKKLHSKLQKHININKYKLASTKYLLYHSILESLRHLFRSENPDFEIRSLLDKVSILYHKSLYQQSYKLLQKAKKTVSFCENYGYIVEVTCWERKLFAYTSGSLNKCKWDDFLADNYKIHKQIKREAELLELLCQMQFLHKNIGVTCNTQNQKSVEKIIRHPSLIHPATTLTFKEKITYYEIYALYHQMRNDYEQAYSNYHQLMKNWEENPDKKKISYKAYCEHLFELLFLAFISQKNLDCSGWMSKFNHNGHHEETYLHLLELTSKMWCALHLEKSDAKQILIQIDALIRQNRYFMNSYWQFRLQYYMALAHSLTNDYRKALYWINQLLNQRYRHFHVAQQHFIRVWYLIIHYELGNLGFVDTVYRSGYRFFKNSPDKADFELIFIRQIRRLSGSIQKMEKKAVLQNLEKILSDFSDNLRWPKQEYAFLQAWVESKLTKESLLRTYLRCLRCDPSKKV